MPHVLGGEILLPLLEQPDAERPGFEAALGAGSTVGLVPPRRHRRLFKHPPRPVRVAEALRFGVRVPIAVTRVAL